MSRAAFSWAIRSRKAVYPAAPYDLLGEDPEKNVAAGTADPGHFRSIATTRFRRLGVVLASAVSALCVVALLAKPLRGFAPLPPLVIPEPNHFLEAYLNAHFDPGKDVVMWTMATGVSPSYVPSALNWNRRRAELEMPDTVVVFCLDRACLEECARAGLRAYGGYVKDEIHIPPPSHGRGKWLKRSGAERGHTMAYIKFKAMVDMAQTSFDSLFFEGDTFLTANPFDHMLSRDDDSWDVQFTEDGNYLLNFGWVFCRAKRKALVEFFAYALSRYLAHNEWDQQLLSKMVRRLGGREWFGEDGRGHWWLCDKIGLRMHMLPLDEFFPYHLEMYTLREDKPSPVMHHLSGVNFANREFYPKERGWATDIDGFYSTPRPILTGPAVTTSISAGAHYARLLHLVAARLDWGLQVPSHMTLTGRNSPNGPDWTYSRSWTRFISVEAAVTNGLDLLEHDFFAHAQKYAPALVLHDWSKRRIAVRLRDFADLDELIAYLERLDVPRKRGSVIELLGFDEPLCKARTWRLDAASVRTVSPAYRHIPMCRSFHAVNIPYEWCYPLPLSFA